MSTDLLIRAENISIQLGGRPVLKDINLELRKSQLLTLIGPNGAGKTTLVRIVLGLLAPDSGTLFRAEKRRIGYTAPKVFVGPTPALAGKPFLEVASPTVNGLGPGPEEVRSAHLLDQQVSQLSGGE